MCVKGSSCRIRSPSEGSAWSRPPKQSLPHWPTLLTIALRNLTRLAWLKQQSRDLFARRCDQAGCLGFPGDLETLGRVVPLRGGKTTMHAGADQGRVATVTAIYPGRSESIGRRGKCNDLRPRSRRHHRVRLDFTWTGDRRHVCFLFKRRPWSGVWLHRGSAPGINKWIHLISFHGGSSAESDANRMIYDTINQRALVLRRPASPCRPSRPARACRTPTTRCHSSSVDFQTPGTAISAPGEPQ
jgi:hypothetical protein